MEKKKDLKSMVIVVVIHGVCAMWVAPAAAMGLRDRRGLVPYL